jgi:hypothetical protein
MNMSTKKTTPIEAFSEQRVEPIPPDSTTYASPAGGGGPCKPETHFDPMMETIVKRGAQRLLQQELASKDSNGHDAADPRRVLFFKLAQADGTKPQLEKLNHEIASNNSDSILRELKLRGAELLILEEMSRKDGNGRPAANPSRLLFLDIAWRNEMRSMLKELQENVRSLLIAGDLQAERSERGPRVVGACAVATQTAGRRNA